jgi:hypothetical protein
MNAVIVKLVVLRFFVGWGLIALGIGYVSLAAAIAFFNSDPTDDRPGLAAFTHAACEIDSTLANPLTIGLESRVLRAIAIDPDGGIDFRALPDRWRHVCLTFVNSGGPVLPSGRLPFLRFERSLCWGWSPVAITVLLIEENGATFPFQLRGPTTVGDRQVDTSPVACSPVKEAHARCVGVDGTGRYCSFQFPAGPR